MSAANGRALMLTDLERLALIALLEAEARIAQVPAIFQATCRMQLRRDERVLKTEIETRLGLRPRSLDRSHTIDVDAWRVKPNPS